MQPDKKRHSGVGGAAMLATSCPGVAVTPPAPPLLDCQDGLARLMGNRQVYAKVLASFVEKQFDRELAAACAAGDQLGAARVLHSVRGAAGNLSLTRLYRLTVRLERAVRAGALAGEDLARFDATYKQTEREIENAIEDLLK